MNFLEAAKTNLKIRPISCVIGEFNTLIQWIELYPKTLEYTLFNEWEVEPIKIPELNLGDEIIYNGKKYRVTDDISAEYIWIKKIK